ncbi:hypothetical protein JCM11251_001459 [Rhodosporidiobolus azoricus]
MMRRGHKSNAIMNSPVVRSFIKPVQSIIPADGPSTSSTNGLNAVAPSATARPYSTADRNPYLAHLELDGQEQEGEDEEQAGAFLIPTQPQLLAGPSSERADANGKGKKRARAPEEGQAEGDSAEIEYDQVEGMRFGQKVRWRDEGEVPEDLKKYWAQRYRLFSLFDDGCELDREGWYSVTPEHIAAQIAERCRCGTIVDAFCGVGGNAIQFAFTCERVIALDISPVRLACARRNAEVYGVADRITFILADWVSWTENYLEREKRGELRRGEKVEVIFLSPPWGGIDYQTMGNEPARKKPRYSHLDSSAPLAPMTPTPVPPLATSDLATASSPSPAAAYPLSALAPQHGSALFRLARHVTHNIAYYLPRNVDLLEVAGLTKVAPWKVRPGAEAERQEKVEVEEEWMGWKLKAVTAYFGELTEQGEVAEGIEGEEES